ncbi:MAG TPA: hypothetical protein VFK33_04335 [Bacillales bacterium]|nr:hypothetical protein [Bacillales bacterium]
MMHVFPAFFGILSLLYILVALFIVVLTIVFLFKAITFMNRKNEDDRRRNQILEDILERHGENRE